MVRVLLVAGTRPEAIKLAPVVLELRAQGGEFEAVFCSTGQHREMLGQVLSVFGLKPDLDLSVMRPRQTLTDLTTSALSALDEAMASVRPDLVIVQGDTTSAMTGALAAYYQRVPVAHVEAGLRTDDIYQPFPEEVNRRFIGTLAALHFAPTPYAAGRLRQEGVPERKILVTGNTVIDALLRVRDNGRTGAVPAAPPDGRRRLLLTMHRRENHGAPLRNVCLAVLELVKQDPDVEVVFPVHPSPLVRETVDRLLGDEPRIRLIEPLGYQEFIRLLDSCYLVLSDSGGIQEEAPAIGKPVLVLRNKTERPESISAGTSQLVGTNPMRVLQVTERLLYDEDAYRAMAHAENPYGDGRAAQRVAAALRFHFGLADERPLPFAPRLPERERRDS